MKLPLWKYRYEVDDGQWVETRAVRLSLLGSRHAVPPSTRSGRTRNWPVATGWARATGRRCGLYARLGNTAWLVFISAFDEPYAYRADRR